MISSKVQSIKIWQSKLKSKAAGNRKTIDNIGNNYQRNRRYKRQEKLYQISKG